MKGENGNLGVLLSSAAEVLQQREMQMMERISALEARIAELEERLARMQAEPVTEVAVVEKEVTEDVMHVQVAIDGLEDTMPVGDNALHVEEEIEIEFEFEEQEPEDYAVEVEDADAVEMEDVVEMEDEDVEGEERDGKEAVSVMERARPDWFDWEVDIPGSHIEDIWDGIGLNDRMLFLNELFGGDEEAFDETVSFLNGTGTLVEATEYIREKYPQWDEECDEVYRFYMTVRRRFNRQKQEE